jgi:hypothetical protein
MTIAIAPRQPAPQQQESFGAKMGTAVGEGLNQLIESKINDLNRQRGIKERKSTYAKASLPTWLAELPDDFQMMFLKEFDLAPEQEKQQIRAEVDRLGEQYYTPAQPGDELEDEEGQLDAQQGVLPNQMMQGQQKELPPYFGVQPKESPIEAKEKENRIPGLASLTSAGEGFDSQSRSSKQDVQSFPALGRGTKGQVSSPQSLDNTDNVVVGPKTTQEPRGLVRKGTKEAELKAQSALRKEQIAEQKQADKESKKYYDAQLEVDKEASAADDRLGKMKRLVNKGDLPIAAFYSLFKNLEESIPPQYGAAGGAALGAALGSVVPGIGTAVGGITGGAIGGLIGPVSTALRYVQRKTSPDTEEFEKLSNQFIKGAKAVFGSRITDNDLKAYMAQIPTLANTDAGKLAIINDMEIVNQAEHARTRAMKQIIKENKGRRPADLQAQVEERAKPELDRLSRIFINS